MTAQTQPQRKAIAQRVIIARSLDGKQRFSIKPGDTLPDWLTGAELAHLVDIGAAAYVEPEPEPAPATPSRKA